MDCPVCGETATEGTTYRCPQDPGYMAREFTCDGEARHVFRWSNRDGYEILTPVVPAREEK